MRQIGIAKVLLASVTVLALSSTDLGAQRGTIGINVLTNTQITDAIITDPGRSGASHPLPRDAAADS